MPQKYDRPGRIRALGVIPPAKLGKAVLETLAFEGCVRVGTQKWERRALEADMRHVGYVTEW